MYTITMHDSSAVPLTDPSIGGGDLLKVITSNIVPLWKDCIIAKLADGTNCINYTHNLIETITALGGDKVLVAKLLPGSTVTLTA